MGTYPSDETAVESVQQVGGNLVSALMLPVAEWALNQDYEFFKKIRFLDSDIRGDVILLFTVAAVTLVYFSTFDAPLRRTMAEEEAVAEAATEIAAIDTDGDGMISKQELVAAGTSEADAETVIARLDADGDGKVDASELAEAP